VRSIGSCLFAQWIAAQIVQIVENGKKDLPFSIL